MSRVSLSPIGNYEDIGARLQSVLSDLEDQLNIRPNLLVAGGSRQPSSKVGDVIFSTLGDTVQNVKVRTGKDSFASLDANTFGITLASLGVDPAAVTQITAGAITLTTLGIHTGAQTQIIAGPITQASIGISAGAITQITAGAITLASLGVTSGVATQLTGLATLSAATLNITLTTFAITSNFQTQLTTGLPAANGTNCSPVANFASGNSLLRFRGYISNASSSAVLAQDGDWGFWHDTGGGLTYLGFFEGATRRYVQLNLT